MHQERFFIISNIPEKPNIGVAGSQLLKSTAVRTIATYDELLLSVRPRRTVRKNQIINPLGSCKSTEKKEIPVPTEPACGERFLKSSLLLFDVQVNCGINRRIADFDSLPELVLKLSTNRLVQTCSCVDNQLERVFGHCQRQVMFQKIA